MTEQRQYIAVDLGAESGRVMLGTVSDTKLALEEIHRFANGPCEVAGTLRWDFEKLFGEIKAGIALAVKAADGPVAGIGVDSWGVDYGLIGADGALVEQPYHYRDSRTDGMVERAYELVPKRNIYDYTGIQFLQFNTMYQLLAARLSSSAALTKATRMIMTADLVSYYLCGEVFAEYSLASTSQLMDMATGRWSAELCEKLSLPVDILPRIVAPGTVVGKLTSELAGQFGCEPIDVIAIGSHDTASAVAAVPARSGKWAYLSSGTWSLIGLEVPQAIINDTTFKYEFTNEGGVESTIRLLKNLAGLWLVQECRRHWQSEGEELSYGELTALAEKAQPFLAYIDCDDDDFIAPGDMPGRIKAYLARTAQAAIEDKGQMVRMVLESLAFKYRRVMEMLEDMAGYKVEVLHIVGGGIQNELLCQFAANATDKKVITGPVEATASGNIIMQAKAKGQIDSLSQGRELVANSFAIKEYVPQDAQVWAREYEKFMSK